MLGRTPADPVVQFSCTVLEDADTPKVVHDCRMGSDALRHCLAIELRNVHAERFVAEQEALLAARES